jgi:hypothetical protein
MQYKVCFIRLSLDISWSIGKSYTRLLVAYIVRSCRVLQLAYRVAHGPTHKRWKQSEDEDPRNRHTSSTTGSLRRPSGGEAKTSPETGTTPLAAASHQRRGQELISGGRV